MKSLASDEVGAIGRLIAALELAKPNRRGSASAISEVARAQEFQCAAGLLQQLT